MNIQIPVSVGELVDKITILEIKTDLINDLFKKNAVQAELDQLNKIFNSLSIPDIADLRDELKMINRELWHIEDAKRRHEEEQRFDNEFVQLARNVYLKNDARARIKYDINIKCKSNIIEFKSHKTV